MSIQETDLFAILAKDQRGIAKRGFLMPRFCNGLTRRARQHPLNCGKALRVLSGACVVGVYMVVESWLNGQSAGPARGQVFAVYMLSTLIALGAGQFLLLAGDSSQLTLFAFAAMLISVGVVPWIQTVDATL